MPNKIKVILNNLYLPVSNFILKSRICSKNSYVIALIFLIVSISLWIIREGSNFVSNFEIYFLTKV